MSPLDTLGHLEAENARLERDNAQLMHDKHQALAERDRARDLAANLEAEYAQVKEALELILYLVMFTPSEEPGASSTD